MEGQTAGTRPSKNEAQKLFQSYRKRLEEEFASMDPIAQKERLGLHICWYFSQDKEAEETTKRGPVSAIALYRSLLKMLQAIRKASGQDEVAIFLEALRCQAEFLETIVNAAAEPSCPEDLESVKIRPVRQFRMAELPPQHRLMVEGQDFLRVLELLRYHPAAEQKIGVGVEAIYVKERAPGIICYFVLRKDGGEEDFSYAKCLKSSERYDRDNTYTALRTAVIDDIAEFREKAWKDSPTIICPISGVKMTREDEESWDVDHHPTPFRDIVREWLALKEGIKMETKESTKGMRTKEFVDKTLEEDFRRFHKQRAGLRIVNKRAHQEYNKDDNRKDALQRGLARN